MSLRTSKGALWTVQSSKVSCFKSHKAKETILATARDKRGGPGEGMAGTRGRADSGAKCWAGLGRAI